MDINWRHDQHIINPGTILNVYALLNGSTYIGAYINSINLKYEIKYKIKPFLKS